jgi:hypothetical protein
MKQHKLNPTNFIMDEIESIELLGERDTIDITVDNTHMFYANDIYTHNSALEEDVIEADKIAESYAKVMVADFVVSLSRKMADKISGTGRWHVIKNRFGPDGLTFPSKMNMSTARIDIYAENTVLGKEAKQMMQNEEEVVRKALANKFSELNSLVS